MDSDRRAKALLLLGLVDPVTKRQVTRAYRRVAKRVHPDTAGPSQADPGRFAAVHDAYEYLLTTPVPRSTPTPPVDQARPQPGGASRRAARDRAGEWIIVGPARVRPGAHTRARP